MLQVTQNYKTGRISIENVEPPALRRGGIIVRSAFSVISAGTELTKVREAKMGIVHKARARPDQVRKVIETARQQGLFATYNKVMNRLDSMTPLGYSLSGIVEAIGEEADEFEIGQRVACAGAEYAHHAEVNFIPRQLAVPVPGSVPLQHAAFTTIGAIAMHAFRQSGLRLGEYAVVVGLGLVGQVLLGILRAAGIRVYGIDISDARASLAQRCGAEAAGAPDDPVWRNAMLRETGWAGADCAFLCVSGTSNEPLELATSVVRDRGKLVIVGKTKLDLDYNSFFRSEIEVLFSRSYGPGRFDPNYEQQGQDYPLGYVRWTERRNMAAYLDLLAARKIDLEPLISEIRPFSAAETVYRELHDGNLRGIGVLFDFGQADTINHDPPADGVGGAMPIQKRGDIVRIGAIGAGNYASSMLFPFLRRNPWTELIAVATASGLSGVNAQKKFGFHAHYTDYRRIIEAPDIDAVVIATPHRLHSAMAAAALRSGKAVFIEKPLAIDEEGLAVVAKASAESGNDRLMVGFNRRYAPIMREIKSQLAGGPLTMVYRVHAGALEQGSWLSDPAEGTRFVGEGGHFLDVFSFLTGAQAISVGAAVLRPSPQLPQDVENISALLRYAEGSVGMLAYLTHGGSMTPKERLEVFGSGTTFVMDNFQSLSVYNGKASERRKRGYGGDKGQRAEIETFVSAVLSGSAFPVSFSDLVMVTRTTLLCQRAAAAGRLSPCEMQTDNLPGGTWPSGQEAVSIT